MMPTVTIKNTQPAPPETVKALALEDIAAGDWVVFQLRPLAADYEASLWRRDFSPIPDAMALHAAKKGDMVECGARFHIDLGNTLHKLDPSLYLGGDNDRD